MLLELSCRAARQPRKKQPGEQLNYADDPRVRMLNEHENSTTDE